MDYKAILKEKYLNQKVIITNDFQRADNIFMGSIGTIDSISYDRYNSRFSVKFESSPNKEVAIGSIYTVFQGEIDLINQKEIRVNKLEKRVKTIEEIDRYGNEYILELFFDKDNKQEEVIYLSSALRTLLNVKNGERINFATDSSLKKYYVFKEFDENAGHEVIDGKIKNNVEWRNLFNTFNPETQNPDKAKLRFHISHYLEKNKEYPEYTFFVINEPWYFEKPKKEIKVKKEKIKPSFNPDEVDWGTTITNTIPINREIPPDTRGVERNRLVDNRTPAQIVREAQREVEARINRQAEELRVRPII